MFYTFAVQPDIFLSRADNVSVFTNNHKDLWGTLAKTIGLSLIKYNFVGDQNWRHNFPPYPVLDPIVGTCFLGGFLFSLGMLFRILRERLRTKRPDTELAVHAFLFAGFISMLAAEFLTNEGLPHALRSIGTQPFALLYATIPLLFLFRKASLSKGSTKVAIIITLALILWVSASWNIVKYFVFWRNRTEQHVSFNENYRNMAEYLVALPKETKKYVVPDSFIAVQPIRFLTDGRTENIEYVDKNTVITIPSVIVMQRYDPRVLTNIQKFMPASHEEHIDLHPGFGSDFTAIIVE